MEPNRIDAVFTGRRPALICYLPVGDPLLSADLPNLYVDSGADILEVGVPVRDPILDGPTISDSMKRAIADGMTTDRAASIISSFRKSLPEQPMVWMSYPDGQQSNESLAEYAAGCGVDGVLLPTGVNGYDSLATELERRGVCLLNFVRHELPEEDVQAAREAQGYVMLQAVPGLTGATPSTLPDSGASIRHLREQGVTVPIVLGIGISTSFQASQAIEMGADGVVMGSAVVKEALERPETLQGFLQELRGAIDGG
jgi:tryptophan synthase alpha chain